MRTGSRAYSASHCDGCQAKFSICHALDFKKGSLVTARHNNLCDGVADLAGKALTPSHVCNEPLIYSGCSMKRTKATPSGDRQNYNHAVALPSKVTEHKGDLQIRDLWQQGTNSVHNMQVVNTDAQSHRNTDPERCLQEAERGKKWVYLESCIHKYRHFSPFVA